MLGVFLLCGVCVTALLIATKKIDLKRHGKYTAFGIIAVTLLAALLLLKSTPLQMLFVKIYVVVMMLFVWLVLFGLIKRRFKK
jgi:hypothetical protein